MTDIDVHVMLRKCCRDVLADIDRRKKKAKFQRGILAAPSLIDMFGDKPVDQARKLLPGGGDAPNGAAGAVGSDLNDVVLKTCRTCCEKHAEKHEGADDKLEAAFWRDLAAGLDGELRTESSPIAQTGADGASGLMGGAMGGEPGTGALGDKIAQKAKEKVKEYKKAGIKYAQTGAPGTADCSHFVHDVLTSSGADVPYTTANGIGTSKHFEMVADPKPGDVVWQPGHIGVYVGKNDKGQPLGAQMGEHGPAVGVWGQNGWFAGADKMKFFQVKGE